MHLFVRILYLYTLCIGVCDANRRKTGLDDAADRGYSVNDDLPVVVLKENQESSTPAEEKTYEKTYVFSPDHTLVYEKNTTGSLNTTPAAEDVIVFSETPVWFSFSGKFAS
jgi:hypothetical protein